jgi:hypothetical protein
MLEGVTDTDGVTAVPASDTVCGLGGLVALSVIVRVPVRAPVDVGEKVTLIVQFAPAAMPPPQLSISPKSLALAPVIIRLAMVKTELPVLLKVSC